MSPRVTTVTVRRDVTHAEHEPEPDQVNVSRTTQGKVRTHTNKRSDSGYIYIHVVKVSRCACVGCVSSEYGCVRYAV